MEAAIGHGSRVLRSNDGTAGGTFADVGELYDIEPPGITRDPVEKTHMLSPERWREFIGGMKDGGELSFNMVFDPDAPETTAMELDLNTNIAGFYKIIYPDSDEWAFSALLTNFQATVPVEDKMMAEVTFKLSGKPGWIA